jgi:phosphatidylinositol 3-kinase
LIIELPDFDIPIIYEETFYPIPQHGACGAVAPFELSVYRKEVASKKKVGHDPNEQFDPLELVQFLDYENEHDNPVEDKYRTLAHDLLRGLVDPALKPDREQRSRLASIIDSPSHHPTREEKDLLWRFRFSLVDNRRALTKFLLAVDWTVESEVVQAAEVRSGKEDKSSLESCRRHCCGVARLRSRFPLPLGYCSHLFHVELNAHSLPSSFSLTHSCWSNGGNVVQLR